MRISDWSSDVCSSDLPLAQPVAALAPRADEILLPKTSSGVFNSTAIDYVLHNLGITHLVIAGIMTDQCVDMAVRDGADRGYMVTCVGDACGARKIGRAACRERVCPCRSRWSTYHYKKKQQDKT